MHEATATRAREGWSRKQFSALICNAGRVTIAELCRLTGHDEGDVRQVAARVRATGYPISLTVDTCPMCGRRAPLTRTEGICEACHYQRMTDRNQRRMASLIPLMRAKDRETYATTEAELSGRKREPMPKAPDLAAFATEAERMEAQDAYEAECAAWAGRNAMLEARRTQKRTERMARKAREAGSDVRQIVALHNPGTSRAHATP